MTNEQIIEQIELALDYDYDVTLTMISGEIIKGQIYDIVHRTNMLILNYGDDNERTVSLSAIVNVAIDNDELTLIDVAY